MNKEMFFCFCLTPQDSLAKDHCITPEKQIQVEDIRCKQVTYSKCSVDDTVKMELKYIVILHNKYLY